MSTAPLQNYKKNVFSQFGEDGLVEEILLRIGRSVELDKWCVEFGAWDGIHLSNTYNLIKNNGYQAVLIEGDQAKYDQLCRNIPSDDVVKICRFVGLDSDSSLDSILKGTRVPQNFDLLSIDIDGCDFFIFQSLLHFRPKIICIEFNPTIPNEIEFVQPEDFSIKRGSSAKSLVGLAEGKGYSLVAATTCNVFFVDDAYRESVAGSGKISLPDVRDDEDTKCYLFSGFDGSILTSAPVRLPWHSLTIPSGALQQLPRFLRKYRRDYNSIEEVIFRIYRVIKKGKRSPFKSHR